MHSAETSGDKAGTRYELEADRLYEQILSRWGFQNNVWRTAWAMDTILDYRRLRGDDKARLQAQMALEALNPQGQGNWWDDFGWIGIAALRAVQQNAFPNDRNRFLRIAINAWAYMYGPGWSTSNEAPLYPFADCDLPGWCKFCCAHRENIGAPNVWKRIDSTFPGVTEDQKYKQQPRHSPGGAWNSPITQHDQPVPSRGYVGENSYLNPVQNTVTNALYALLTLRVLQASDHPDFKSVFDEAKLDLRACRQAWIDQAGWLDSWCTPAALSGEDRVPLSVRPNPAALAILVRERVSTYLDSRTSSGTKYWDSSYDANLIWIGDQGLMLGVLREGQVLPTPAPTFTRPENIIAGVFEHGFAKRLYGGVSGVFPLPWIDLAAMGDAIYDAPAPGKDSGDYQTGVAVFMRYLLQAHESAGGQLPENHARMVRDCADRLLRPEFDPSDAQPGGVCDAFVAYSVDGQPPPPEEVNLAELTPLVNRLSILLMAIALERSS